MERYEDSKIDLEKIKFDYSLLNSYGTDVYISPNVEIKRPYLELHLLNKYHLIIIIWE